MLMFKYGCLMLIAQSDRTKWLITISAVRNSEKIVIVCESLAHYRVFDGACGPYKTISTIERFVRHHRLMGRQEREAE